MSICMSECGGISGSFVEFPPHSGSFVVAGKSLSNQEDQPEV